MVNFARIIRDLQKQGWTQEKIAAQIGCRQSNISAILRDGRRPSYDLGTALIALHRDLKK